MQNLLEELKKLLEQDERLVVDGKLLKNKVIESALKLDVELIKLLLKSETIKKHFFQEVDGVLVFDKRKFQKFVSNKAFLPDSWTSFKNKIGLVTENEEYLSESKEVVLAWPYKDCVLEGGMEKEDEKRNEIFYNEILAPDEIDRLLEPKVLTNFKRIDKNGEHKVTEIKENDNLIIRGNNLLALHLLQKRFAGQVKLIYIDPPYYFSDTKSGDTFTYNTNFKLSTWLVFMRNRLSIAKNLLTKDGSIFVQISDEGAAHLKLLLDEVFVSENFVNVVSVRMKNIAGASGGGEDKRLKKNIEFIYIYSKITQFFQPFKNVHDYKELHELTQEYKENGVSWKYTSVLYNPGKKELQGTYWDGFNLNNLSKEGRVELENGKKPEALLERIIEMATKENEIILDYHLGSGTTCAVAHKKKRQYIGVEQLDYGENDSVVRLKNVINGDQSGISKSENWQGGGDFIYCELMKLNEKYIDEIKKAKTTKQLLDIWKTMKEKAFLSYKIDVKQFDENVNEFEELSLENQKKFLIECLDKNQLYVNYSEIDDEDYGASEGDKKLNGEFYS